MYLTQKHDIQLIIVIILHCMRVVVVLNGRQIYMLRTRVQSNKGLVFRIHWEIIILQ